MSVQPSIEDASESIDHNSMAEFQREEIISHQNNPSATHNELTTRLRTRNYRNFDSKIKASPSEQSDSNNENSGAQLPPSYNIRNLKDMKGGRLIKKVIRKKQNKKHFKKNFKMQPNPAIHKYGSMASSVDGYGLDTYEESLDDDKGMAKYASESFLYKPFIPLPDLSEFVQQLIEVRVGAEYMCKSNKAFRMGNFWGSDIYTSDSDVVCILQHTSMFTIKDLPPNNLQGVSVIFRVTKGRNSYPSSYKNSIRSKKRGAYEGYSIKPERYECLADLGNKEELCRMASLMPTILASIKKKNPYDYKGVSSIPEAMMQFNLSFEPAFKYTLASFANSKSDYTEWTSPRMQREVLYIESDNARYEISKMDEKMNNKGCYRFAKVNDPFFKGNDFMSSCQVPLPLEDITIIEADIDWHDIQWGVESVKVKDKLFPKIRNFKFYSVRSYC